MKKSFLILFSIFILFSCGEKENIQMPTKGIDEKKVIIGNISNTSTTKNISSKKKIFPTEFEKDINEMNILLDENN